MIGGLVFIFLLVSFSIFLVSITVPKKVHLIQQIPIEFSFILNMKTIRIAFKVFCFEIYLPDSTLQVKMKLVESKSFTSCLDIASQEKNLNSLWNHVYG